jgi:hypothetical protein
VKLLVDDMGKPRVIEVRERKKKPRIKEERDYSLLLDDDEDTSGIILHRKIEHHFKDASRDKLREDMLADITPIRAPLDQKDLKREIDQDQKKRHSLGKKIKKTLGLE